MTTPNQLPIDGAYVIDEGGGEYNFGQGLTDKSAAGLMVQSFPSINLFNPLEAVGAAIGVVTDTLFKLPLEVLQLFEQLIPGDLGGAFETVAGAVGAIVDQLSTVGSMFGSVAFSVLSTGFDLLSTAVNQIMDIFNGLVVTPINSVIQGVLDWWNGITGQTAANTAAASNAQATADNALVGVARLEGLTGSSAVPGGVLIHDTFDRTASTMGPDYTVSHSGTGGGHIETDGNNSRYVVSGSDAAFEDALHNTPLHTEYQGVQIVQGAVIANILTPPVLFLYGRSNSAKTYRVEAIVRLTTAEIWIVVAGTATQLGAAVSVTNNPGDKWYLKLGTDTPTTGVREFVLYQNTTEVCRRTDTGATSQYGAGYDQPGYVQGAGQQFIPPFFFIQIEPPELQSFTAYDRLPASA